MQVFRGGSGNVIAGVPAGQLTNFIRIPETGDRRSEGSRTHNTVLAEIPPPAVKTRAFGMTPCITAESLSLRVVSTFAKAHPPAQIAGRVGQPAFWEFTKAWASPEVFKNQVYSAVSSCSFISIALCRTSSGIRMALRILASM